MKEKLKADANSALGEFASELVFRGVDYFFPGVGTGAEILLGGGGDDNKLIPGLPGISDVNLKTDLVKVGINNQGLNLYIWEWNNIAKELGIDSTNSPTYGVVAQEAINFVPSAVSTDQKTGYLQVDYSKIHLPPLENISIT